MSKLVWDKDGERFYEVGVDRGVCYPYNSSSEGRGSATTLSKYTKGAAWNGLTAVNESPSGAEATPIYADNIKYLNITSKEEYGASVEAYTYPDEFEECDGSVKVGKGLRLRQQTRKTFGLSFRSLIGNDIEKEDYGYKITLVYGATASPSEKSHSTINENIEPGTMSWELTTTPVPVEDIENKKIKPIASLDIKSVDYWDTTNNKYQDGFIELEKALYGIDAKEAVGTEGQDGYEAAVTALDPWLPMPNDVYKILEGQMDAYGNAISGS